MNELFHRICTTAVIYLAATTATAAPQSHNIPAHLNDKSIHFSYSPAYKLSPLILCCRQSIDHMTNTYRLTGEQGACHITYTPAPEQAIATISVNGAKDNAEIKLIFENDTCGTAHMTWNKIPYYHLRFRILESGDSATAYYRRMGAPISNIVPQSLAGKKLVVDFRGAVEQFSKQDGAYTPWNNCEATPLVVQFPGDRNTFCQPIAGISPIPPLKVEYSLIGSGAAINISDPHGNINVELDFFDKESGLAHIHWPGEEGSGWSAKCATFKILPADTAQEALSLPNMYQDDEVDAELCTLLQDLAMKRYDTEVERLYQRRLLSVLPFIPYGAMDANTVIPNANGTTAIHNACGLSHVQLVQWLLNHGADLNATTAKGATVDDCVDGPNAKAIRAILKQARHKKK